MHILYILLTASYAYILISRNRKHHSYSHFLIGFLRFIDCDS